MHYTAGSFTQYDNFCRLSVHREESSILVRTFGADGAQLKSELGAPIEDRLQLVAW